MQDLTEIAERIHQLTNWKSIPTYVIRQLGALAGNDTIKFIDISVRENDSKIDGALISFTDANVIHINWQSDAFVRTGDARVSSKTWSRRQLQYVRLDDEKNSTAVWHEDWGDQWPKGATLDLVYRNSESLSLPLADRPATYANAPQHRADILEFLPELLKDLQ